MDDNPEPFYTFSQLEEVANFLLYEAFRYAHLAAEYEVAGVIFGERIMSIDPEPGWSISPLPTALSEWLRIRDSGDDTTDETILRLRDAWKTSYADAAKSGTLLPKAHKFTSTYIVGHVINLSACVETVINRHLFQLRESGDLDAHHYNSLDKAELLPKILFAFKNEIQLRKLSTARLKHLVTLRNNAVHFKEASVDAVTPTGEELIGIWREIGQLLGFVSGEPTTEQINLWAVEFMAKWLQHGTPD